MAFDQQPNPPVASAASGDAAAAAQRRLGILALLTTAAENVVNPAENVSGPPLAGVNFDQIILSGDIEQLVAPILSRVRQGQNVQRTTTISMFDAQAISIQLRPSIRGVIMYGLASPLSRGMRAMRALGAPSRKTTVAELLEYLLGNGDNGCYQLLPTPAENPQGVADQLTAQLAVLNMIPNQADDNLEAMVNALDDVTVLGALLKQKADLTAEGLTSATPLNNPTVEDLRTAIKFFRDAPVANAAAAEVADVISDMNELFEVTPPASFAAILYPDAQFGSQRRSATPSPTPGCWDRFFRQGARPAATPSAPLASAIASAPPAAEATSETEPLLGSGGGRPASYISIVDQDAAGGSIGRPPSPVDLNQIELATGDVIRSGGDRTRLQKLKQALYLTNDPHVRRDAFIVTIVSLLIWIITSLLIIIGGAWTTQAAESRASSFGSKPESVGAILARRFNQPAANVIAAFASTFGMDSRSHETRTIQPGLVILHILLIAIIVGYAISFGIGKPLLKGAGGVLYRAGQRLCGTRQHMQVLPQQYNGDMYTGAEVASLHSSQQGYAEVASRHSSESDGAEEAGQQRDDEAASFHSSQAEADGRYQSLPPQQLSPRTARARALAMGGAASQLTPEALDGGAAAAAAAAGGVPLQPPGRQPDFDEV